MMKGKQASGSAVQEPTSITKHGYADVTGLKMYYEIHGSGQPLVLLHGALSATGTSFGTMLPSLARSRQVISVEQQAHGHTADIDRPLSIEQMTADTAALLDQIGIKKADFFGYSMGSGIALNIALKHPCLVRKLVLASISYNKRGFHPGLMAGLDELKPENLARSDFEQEYVAMAPNPGDWPKLIEKIKHLNCNVSEWTAEAV